MKKLRLIAVLVICAITGNLFAQSASCPGYRTQTQGGWGSIPSGSNPGTYLNNNFAAAFPAPAYLTIGCTNKLQLTSAAAVRAFLPQTATPVALPAGTKVNPTKTSYKNVFAGQLVTLAINLRFDDFIPSFSPSSGHLRDLYITQGPFIGWTVGHLFDEANKKIGGCAAANFSLSQYNDALDRINRNYDNGIVSGNYLACELRLVGVKVDNLCYGDQNGSINLTIIDGVPPYSIQWSNGATSEDLSGLAAGVYSVTVTDAAGVSKSLSFTILQPAAPVTVSASATNVSCNGMADGSITASASAGASITVNGQPYVAGMMYGPGSYTVMASAPNLDGSGVCTASQIVVINEPALVSLSASSVDVTCYGLANGSISAMATGGASITVNGVAYNAAAQYGPGSYHIVASAPNGNNNGVCEDDTTIVISEPSALSVSGSSTLVSDCDNGVCDATAEINISGGIAPYSIMWSNGAMDVTSLTGLCSADAFSVEIHDANGCPAMWDFGGIECQPHPCDTLLTYTMGGWGAIPHGSNPGVYLHANFSGAFPNGLTLGCTNTFTLTNAQAVTDWLPTGTTPAMLPAGNMINNTGYNNVLAGQLAAAMLAVTFDAYDANFAASNDWLGDRFVNVAPFQGMTVSQLIAEANNFIGGCASSYSAPELNAALTAVNENYDNGNMDNGDLVCVAPQAKLANNSGLILNSSIAPNPCTDMFNMEIALSNASAVSVEILDVQGRVLMNENFNLESGSNHIKMNTGNIQSQLCLVRITAGNQLMVNRLMIAK